MAETKIEWTRGPNGEQGFSFNPWVGCTKVSDGCNSCYAESWAKRSGSVTWGGERRLTSAANWAMPLKWNRIAAETGTRPRVFCASLADVFDNQVLREWRYDLLWLISNTPNLDWLLLTKRIGNAQEMLDSECARMGFPWSAERWPHVWLGATVCNQKEADRDVPKLLAVPARVRFLSIEPMLGPIDISTIRARFVAVNGPAVGDISAGLIKPLEGPCGIDWVICGGESGPKARPMRAEWARSLRDQCEAANVAFLLKQWGEWLPDNQNPTMAPPHDQSGAIKVGKKSAGRLLDGVEHNGYPKWVTP